MSLVTTLEEERTKPWERTRVTGDRRTESAKLGQRQIQACFGNWQPQCSLLESNTAQPTFLPGRRGCSGTGRWKWQPLLELGPSSTHLTPGGPPGPFQAHPAQVRGEPLPSRPLPEPPLWGLCTRPPSHEPAGKTGERVSRGAGVLQTWHGLSLSSPFLGQSFPTPPSSAGRCPWAVRAKAEGGLSG